MDYAAMLKVLVAVDGVKRAQSQILSLEGSLRKVTKMAAVGGAALALGAGATAAIKVAASFEKQLSSLGAVTDATGRQMDRLKKQALDMGAKTAFSAREAAAAQTELAKGGMTVRQVLKGGLQGALALAAAGEMELADAAATTANTLNLFKMRASQAGRVADMLATAANATTADVADFAEALTNGGTAAKAAGWNLKQTTLALEALASIGVKGGEAGTTLKSALIALSNPTATQAEATDELGLKFFDAQGEMKNVAAISRMLRDRLGGLTKQQKLATLSTIGGSYGMRGLLAIMEAGPRKIAKYARGLDRQGSAAEVAAKKQDNLHGKLETLGGAVETIGIKVGSVAIPALTDMTVAVTGLLDKIGSSPVLDSLGEKLGAGAEQARTVVTGAFDQIKQVVDANRASLDQIGQSFQSLASKVGGAFSQVGSILSSTFGGGTGFAQDLRNIAGAVIWLGAKFADFASGVAGRVIPGIIQQFQGFARIVRGVVRVISGLLTLDFKRVWDGLKDIVGGALQGVIGTIRAQTGPMREMAARLGRVALGGLSDAWSAIAGVASDAWHGAVSGVRAAIGAVKSAAVAVAKGGLGALKSAWSGLKGLASDAFSRLVAGIKAKIEAVRSAASSIGKAALNALKSLPGLFLQLGKDMIQGLINGVRSMAGAAKNAVVDVVTAPYKAAKDVLGIGSPSKVFRQVGVWTAQGFIDGMASMAGKVGEVAAQMARAATDSVGKAVKGSQWLFPLEAKLRQLEAKRDALQAKWDKQDRVREAASARLKVATGGTSGAGGATSLGKLPVIAGGRYLQKMGLQVAESKYFGGVTTNRHAHYANDHYSGNSIDVNYPGGGAGELRKLQSALAALRKQFGGLVKAFIEDAGTANQHLHATFQASFGRAAKTARAAKATMAKAGRSVLSSRYNSIYPAHPTGTSGAALSPGEVMALAMKAGFSKSQARQVVRIARGESSFMPGIYNSKDNGMGLLQMTPIAGGWGAAAKAHLEKLGGINAMRNPLKNMQMAKWLFDRSGFSPWNLTRYGNSGLYGDLEPANLSGRVKGGDGASIDDAIAKVRDLKRESKIDKINLRIEGLERIKAFREAIAGVKDMIAGKLSEAVDKFRDKWERTVGKAMDAANAVRLSDFDKATDAMIANTPAAQRLAALRAIDDQEAAAAEDQRNQQALQEAQASGDPQAIADAQRQIAATARAREEVALEKQVAQETQEIEQTRADERTKLEEAMAKDRAKRKRDDVADFRRAEKDKLDTLVDGLRKQALTYKEFYDAVRPILKEMGVKLSKKQDFDAETEAAISAIGSQAVQGAQVAGAAAGTVAGHGGAARGAALIGQVVINEAQGLSEERVARKLARQIQIQTGMVIT